MPQFRVLGGRPQARLLRMDRLEKTLNVIGDRKALCLCPLAQARFKLLGSIVMVIG